MDFFVLCHDILKRLSASDPQDANLQKALAAALNNIGSMRLQLGNASAALEDYRHCHDILMRLIESDPKNANVQLDLSTAKERLGTVHLRLGSAKPAVEYHKQSLALLHGLAESDPKDTEIQSKLGTVLTSLGDAQGHLGDSRAALDSHKEALGMRRRLADADPMNASAQRAVSVSLQRIGDIQMSLSDTTAALGSYHRFLANAERVAKLQPKNAEVQHDLFVCYFKLGTVQQSTRAFADAVRWYEKALEVPRRFAHPEFFLRNVAIAETRLRFCQAADKALADPTSVQGLASPLRLEVLGHILAPLSAKKQRDKLLIVADLLAKEQQNDGALYNAVCAFSLCVPLTEKADEREKHALRAVALLKQAIDKGYKNLAHIQKDTDLDPIRNREDFRQVVKTLEANSQPR